jgi:hypothetical protein
MQHPISKPISIKYGLPEATFKKCGKQEKGQKINTIIILVYYIK